MKKIPKIVFFCFITTIFLSACNAEFQYEQTYKDQNQKTEVGNIEQQENTLLTSTKDSTDTEIIDNEEAFGGDSKFELLTKHEFGFYGVDMFIINIVGKEKFEDWLSQFESYNNPEGRNKWEITVVNAVLELNVPKETFIKANNGFVYTDEQIEAIYSGDQKLINKIFVNEDALLINDEIYTADWLASRTAKDYERAGISEEELIKYLDKINIIDFKEEYLPIKGVLIKTNKAKSLPISNINIKPSKLELLAPYQLEYYGLDSFIHDIVDYEKLTEWRNEFLVEYNWSRRRNIEECNIINLVKELNIKEEDFVKANKDLIYSKEQIKAIYSDNQEEINKAFANEYALLVDGEIYSIEWLMRNNKKDYENIGITKEILDNYLKKINIPQLENEFEYIGKIFR
ncbi:hypothetical protein [Alkaliphilus peptidifermentans]|uniref:Lipoprotein n=1 Tax=Alkaliphilus peptidifermentans DSM 18978 TaxID=1120976 RepID=A0A1G5FD90_9FIRM|nr:hypothetical protein [Alkaliphilus peptidifermentans]SCY37235.1 hypothetical protein SAMN03080606_01382 [Alkaliphilus peptidifermentans DSM 18978]